MKRKVRVGAVPGSTWTIAVVPDSFKGSLTAEEAADSLEEGLRRALPDATFRKIPMADGGEGTVSAIVAGTKGRVIATAVRNPLGRRIRASFGMSGDGRTAILEMAAASGLVLLRPEARNPLRTTTAGTGDLIRAALDRGVTSILIGIGGSATNDGGMGMARALGVRFLDSTGRAVPEGGGGLARLDRIDASGLDPRLARVRVVVACDVDNPLCGQRGASVIYGPQKGATPGMVRRLDANLRRLAAVMKRDLKVDVARIPGSGAAGGLGAGLVGFLGATLRPGVGIVADAVRLEERLRGCDLVITGEGRMDGQTVNGKTPAGVAAVAGRLGIPTIAICGCVGPGVQAVHAVGIAAVFSSVGMAQSEESLLVTGARRLADTAEEVGRLLRLGGLVTTSGGRGFRRRSGRS